jgi:hypothetical protein
MTPVLAATIDSSANLHARGPIASGTAPDRDELEPDVPPV